jgi:D-aminoacyl-tRNA deacylase
MLILASETDAAARNIRDRLLTLRDHDIVGEFEGHSIIEFEPGKVRLATIPFPALEFDNPHRKVFPDLPDPDVMVYLSRHQSVSGTKTLTVHPIGNFSEAVFGGHERTVAPSSPHLMTHALRLLSSHPIEGYEITFEATHHGPFNEVPTFFIEIGSTETEWKDPIAVEALAQTMDQLIHDYLDDVIPTTPTNAVCIGLGGGHYAPRHTKHALQEDLDFGHIVPSYARKGLDTQLAEEIIRKTPGVTRVCAHRKKHRKEGRVFQELGLEYIEY